MKIIVFFLTSSLFLPAIFGWDLKKNEGGVKVYTRKVAYSNFKEYKAETEVTASLSSVVALLMNTEDLTMWADRIIEARLLKKVSETETISRTVTQSPWPLKNREALFVGKIRQDAKTKIVTLTTKGLPEYLPPTTTLERVFKLKGSWTLAPQPNGIIRVTMIGHTDPGGIIPAVVANQFVVVIPFNTVKNLRSQIKNPKYQNIKFRYIKE